MPAIHYHKSVPPLKAYQSSLGRDPRYTCILTNRRRNGEAKGSDVRYILGMSSFVQVQGFLEVFQNLLHMSSLRIGHSMYVLGIQANWGQLLFVHGECDSGMHFEIECSQRRTSQTLISIWMLEATWKSPLHRPVNVESCLFDSVKPVDLRVLWI